MPGSAVSSSVSHSTVATSPPGTMPDLGPANVLPPIRYVPGRDIGQAGHFKDDPEGQMTRVRWSRKRPLPAAGEFPVPFAVSGQRPVLPGDPPTTPQAPMIPGAGGPRSKEIPLPPLPSTTDAGAVPGTPAKKTKPKKPVKIDPALLERALMNRNSGR